MDSLMAIYKDPNIYINHKSNEFIWLLEWLDTKLETSDTFRDHIKRSELYKFINTEYSNRPTVFIIKIKILLNQL